MSVFGQVDADQLADGDAPLSRSDVEALLASSADERIAHPAAAWLNAYRLACWLGFSETTAHAQASAAWDRAALDVEAVTVVTTVERN